MRKRWALDYTRVMAFDRPDDVWDEKFDRPQDGLDPLEQVVKNAPFPQYDVLPQDLPSRRWAGPTAEGEGALSGHERIGAGPRQRVLGIFNAPEYRDLSSNQIVPRLAGEDL